LNDLKVIEEIKGEIKNGNENTAYQNLWNTAKAVLRGKLVTMKAYIKKSEISRISNLKTHVKVLEKPKISRKKDK
jgi:hypothetical protein